MLCCGPLMHAELAPLSTHKTEQELTLAVASSSVSPRDHSVLAKQPPPCVEAWVEEDKLSPTAGHRDECG